MTTEWQQFVKDFAAAHKGEYAGKGKAGNTQRMRDTAAAWRAAGHVPRATKGSECRGRAQDACTAPCTYVRPKTHTVKKGKRAGATVTRRPYCFLSRLPKRGAAAVQVAGASECAGLPQASCTSPCAWRKSSTYMRKGKSVTRKASCAGMTNYERRAVLGASPSLFE